MTFEAIVFDADETIFNNQGIHLIVTKQIIEDLGLPLLLVEEFHKKWDYHYFQEQSKQMEEVGFCIDRENNSRSLIKTLKEYNIELDSDKANSYWKFMIREYSTKSSPYQDALELIYFSHKKNIKMGIVSNGDQEIIDLRLKKAKIDHYFEFVIAPCHDLPLTKPDLKVFEESLILLDTIAEKTIFVGDNPDSDIVGANQAGMFSVLIDRYNLQMNLKGLQIPKLKITTFHELINVLK